MGFFLFVFSHVRYFFNSQLVMMESLLLCFCFCLFRSLLCNLVHVKLGCYELEGKNFQSVEDYLKAFMETEVKPLWPKGWMQARSVSVKWVPDHHMLRFT